MGRAVPTWTGDGAEVPELICERKKITYNRSKWITTGYIAFKLRFVGELEGRAEDPHDIFTKGAISEIAWVTTPKYMAYLSEDCFV